MTAPRIRPGIVAQTVRWTALLAILLMSLIARGTMAAQAADGSMVLVLCTPDGMQEITLGPDGQPADPSGHPGDDPRPAICAFAVALGAATATAPLALPLPQAPASSALAQWPAPLPPALGPAPEIPANPRAPPLSA